MRRALAVPRSRRIPLSTELVVPRSRRIPLPTELVVPRSRRIPLPTELAVPRARRIPLPTELVVQRRARIFPRLAPLRGIEIGSTPGSSMSSSAPYSGTTMRGGVTTYDIRGINPVSIAFTATGADASAPYLCVPIVLDCRHETAAH